MFRSLIVAAALAIAAPASASAQTYTCQTLAEEIVTLSYGIGASLGGYPPSLVTHETVAFLAITHPENPMVRRFVKLLAIFNSKCE